LRKLVVLSCVILIISGIMLAYSELLPWVKESSAKEEAEDIKKQLEEAGATVTLK